MKVEGVVGKEIAEQRFDALRDQRTTQTKSFASFLDEQLGSREFLNRTDTPWETAGWTASSGASAFGWNDGLFHGDVEQVQNAVEALGEHLEGIERSVRGETVGLKEVEEAIAGLCREAESFRNRVKELPENHPFRQIGDELRVLAYVESIKWKRGDYLES